jgi:hypothetical protein
LASRAATDKHVNVLSPPSLALEAIVERCHCSSALILKRCTGRPACPRNPITDHIVHKCALFMSFVYKAEGWVGAGRMCSSCADSAPADGNGAYISWNTGAGEEKAKRVCVHLRESGVQAGRYLRPNALMIEACLCRLWRCYAGSVSKDSHVNFSLARRIPTILCGPTLRSESPSLYHHLRPLIRVWRPSAVPPLFFSIRSRSSVLC